MTALATRSHTRAANISPASFDEAAQTIDGIASTFADVERRDSRGPYVERLDPAGLDATSIVGVPLLDGHRQGSARDVLGIVQSYRFEDGKLVTRLRLSQAVDAAPAITRIREGMVRLSISYSVSRWIETTDPQTKARVRTAAAWRILEVSAVPVPADRGATFRSENTMEDDVIELTPAQRRAEIRSIGRAAGMTAEAVDDMIDRDLDATAARAEAFEAMQARQRSTPRIRVVASHDDPAAIVTRAADAVAHRMGGLATLPDASREYRGMSILDLARDSLARAGVSVRGMSVDDVLQRAAHGTSDFPLIVSNAANKTLQSAYQAAESPLKTVARERTLPNFKESTSIRLGGMGRLEKLSEHGEIKATSRGEAGEKLTLATYARRFDLTRKLMIDDDLSAFGDIVAALGQAAAQTEADLLVAQLLSNPVMSDGKAVFHADHGNLLDGAGLAGATGEEALSEARKAMRGMKDLDGKTLINATPKYLLVGPELETDAEKILATIQATTVDDVNPFAGKLSLLVEPRIEDTQWYVFADPARLTGLQYAYLSGASGPQIQRQEMWDSLGVSFRVFEDFGAGWVDYRAAQKNPGE